MPPNRLCSDRSSSGLRPFYVIWAGQLVSLIGSGLTGFALAVWIFDRTGQATPFALTNLFAILPRVLISPLAGSIVDRFSRRTIMILADTGNAAVTLLVFVLLRFSELQIWHIYSVALLISVCSAFQEPAYTASISLLVPKSQLGRANGLVSAAQALEILTAPLLAGGLFLTIGLSGIILIDFVTYFVGIAALLLVRIPSPVAANLSERSAGSLWQDIAYGFKYLRGRRGLLGLLIYFALVNFMLNSTAGLSGPLVLTMADAGALGIVQTLMGAGMLIGSIVMSAWGGPRRRITGVLGFVGLGGIGLAIAGLHPSATVVAVGGFLLMLCVPLASGSSQAIFQTKVAPAVQGRVFAIRTMISRSMLPLAYASAGPLADRVFEPVLRDPASALSRSVGGLIGIGPGRGMGLMFMIGGLALLIATAVAYASPRIRYIEDELPDAIPSAPEVGGVTEAMPAEA